VEMAHTQTRSFWMPVCSMLGAAFRFLTHAAFLNCTVFRLKMGLKMGAGAEHCTKRLK
jgi:hypothetical protein